METGRRHIDIDELFRNQLEKEGVEPSAVFSKTVMRKVAGREFLRFNPSRFNIWYTAIIAAGIIAAGIIVFSGRESSGQLDDVQGQTGNNTIIVVPSENDIPKSPARKPVAKLNKKESPATTVETSSPASVSQAESPRSLTEEKPINSAGLDGSHRKTGFFDKPVSGSLKERNTESTGSLFEPSVLAGCAPLRISFSNNAKAYEKFSWNFGDGGKSELKEPEWIFSNPGEYSVSVNASAEGKPDISHTIQIRVYPVPKADFEISPEKVVIPDEEVRFLNYSRDAVAFRWDFGDGSNSGILEPTHRYTRFGTYNVKLVATSENGCSDSVTVNNAFSGSAYFIEMPNAFIPNPHGPSGGFYTPKSDESAEIFHPSCSGISVYHMQIFSKRGVLLFETNDINVGWDGYYKGELNNPGVYVWKISGRFSNGQTFSKMGDVTLLKN